MQFLNSNLPSPALPWARQVEQALSQALTSIGSGFNQTDNTTRAQASTIAVIGKRLGDLQTIVAGLTISASQVTAGTFGSGVILPSGNISGNISNTLIGNASSSGTGTFNGGLYSTDAYYFNMTGTRVAGWHQIDGHIGTASSSRRFKTNIVDSLLSSPERAEALLKIVTVHYNYIAEVAKRDDPESPSYVGPDFHVHTEVGMIAEDLHNAGFWEFVVYEHDESGDLALDENGNAIPHGIHYEIFSVGVLAVTQYLASRLDKIEDRLSKLEDNS